MKRIITALLVAAAAVACTTAPSAVDPSVYVLENIATRTSIRAYTDEPVSDQDIEILLRAAMAAPTAMNAQPWEFVVLKDRESLKSLAGQLRYARMLESAPLAIVVCAESMMTGRDGIARENIFWEHDASAATENMLLAAHAIGLGAVWTAASDPERSAVVKEALGIPGTIMPLAIVVIGHPGESPEPKDKWKPEKIHYGRW